jgi:hypothetical protein
MRVAAGVLLIIAAVMNFFAGIFYLGGGAAVGSMDKLATMAEQAQEKQGKQLTEQQKQQFEEMHEARRKMSPAERAKMDSVSRIAMAYGLFLLVTVGTSIAGAVCLFRRRAVKFIVVAAALALVAEVVSCVVVAAFLGAAVGATKVLFSSVGIIAGILGILGARQIAKANAVPAEMPPAMATPR